VEEDAHARDDACRVPRNAETETRPGGDHTGHIKREPSMALTKRRRVRVHDRHLSIQAQQAIGGDIVRALVELITNSDDSYRRLADAGVRRTGPADGRIEVEMERRRDGTTLRVRDYAEGMTLQHMHHGVGTYAGDTSGIREGGTVRGMWGHGLKDAILGLGHGRVMSIRDRAFCECALSSGPNGAPLYEYGDETVASQYDRVNAGIQEGNGTVVAITIDREDVRIPQFATLSRNLALHRELRLILANKRRDVVLHDVTGNRQQSLQYLPPYATPGASVTKILAIPGYNARAILHIHRSDTPLDTPAESRDYGQGGILVTTKNDIVLDSTLFGFERCDVDRPGDASQR
jgi:hypothetical protein